MPNIEKAIEKFHKLPIEVMLTVDSDEIFGKLKPINKKYGLDFSYLIILLVVNELNYEDAPKFIAGDMEMNENKAKKIFIEIKDEVLDYLVDRLNFISSDINKEDLKNGKISRKLFKIFSNNLKKEILKHKEIIKSVNFQIFLCMKEDLKLLDNLEKALYNNQEILTSSKFLLNQKEKQPTISNWIKNFIKENGTDIFNNIVLSKYLAESDNVKNLKEEEKHLVKRLLLLYRNLKFFPDSMPSDNVDDWEIIPVERTTDDTVRNMPLGAPKTKSEREIDNLKEEEEKYSQESLERAVIEEKVEGKSRIEELRIELKKYKEGSLERLSIEEEIKKLEY